MNEHPVNIICLKWGSLYDPEYVNRLYHGVKRNLSRPFRFICYTDNKDNASDCVECLDFPDFSVDQKLVWSAWRKFCVLRDDVPFEGSSLFLDLDVLIPGSLNEVFEYGDTDPFVIIHNWIEWQKNCPVHAKRSATPRGSVSRPKNSTLPTKNFSAKRNGPFTDTPTPTMPLKGLNPSAWVKGYWLDE